MGTVCRASELQLAGIFSDRMVLQRDVDTTIWGQGKAESRVTVHFGDHMASTVADDNHRWKVTLPPMPAAAEGSELMVKSGDESVVLKDVVVGDIWHASGQSNMAMTVSAVGRRLTEVKEQIKGFVYPSIRFRRISEKDSPTPKADIPVGKGWIACSPGTVGNFSAAAFFFARRLHEDQSIPIGVIDSSRGGTPIEPFIPRTAFKGHPTLVRELELGDQEDLEGLWKLDGGVRARSTTWLPGRLFHSRLAPITDFKVKGTIWYQGESNCGVGEDPRDYQYKMRALVNGWRSAMHNEEMPVYFVQLPGSGARYGWPFLREQQRLSQSVPGTGMVVTIDLLDSDIHPPNKIDVGERLARWALAKTYGRRIPFSGPMFARLDIQKNKAIVHFQHAKDGLMVGSKQGLDKPKELAGGKLSHFELAGSDNTWHSADAFIKGSTVIAQSAEVPQPTAVRYGFAVNPQNCNLYNRAGLPASPFCSDPKRLTYARQQD